MGFRLRWRVRVAPGVHLNVSKSGFSVSLGGAPATLNIGRKGLKGTISAPGTGLSYSKDLPYAPSRGESTPPQISDIPAPPPPAGPDAVLALTKAERDGPGIFPALIGFGLVLLVGFGLWKALTPASWSETPTIGPASVVAPEPLPAPIDVPVPRPRPATR